MMVVHVKRKRLHLPFLEILFENATKMLISKYIFLIPFKGILSQTHCICYGTFLVLMVKYYDMYLPLLLKACMDNDLEVRKVFR